MYVIKNNAIVKADLKSVVKFGKITDARVGICELSIANYYGVGTYDLNTFYKDSPAKLMCCFILHDAMQYSIESLAKRYKINAGFLKLNITKYYKKCLLDVAFLELVNSFKDAVLYSKAKLETCNA